MEEEIILTLPLPKGSSSHYITLYLTISHCHEHHIFIVYQFQLPSGKLT